MENWQQAYAQRLHNFKMFDWTILQIKNQIQKTYFRGLKRNMRYRKLKKIGNFLFIQR